MSIVSPNPLRDLFDAAARHYTIKVTCKRCGHIGIFDPHALWWQFERRSWNDNLRAAAGRMWCSSCFLAGREKVKWPALELSSEEPTIDWLKMPDARDWKRATSRRR